MKKYILAAFVLVLVNVNAQKGFHIGASGTFAATFIYTQNNYGTLAPFELGVVRASEMNYKFTLGGRGGVVLGYNFKHNWGLQAEVQYLSTGQKYEDNFTGPADLPSGKVGGGGARVNVKRDIRLTYVRIPLMAKYISNGGHVAKFYCALGPEFGVRILAKEEVRIANRIYQDTLGFSPDQKFQRFDLGVALQLGTEIFVTDNLYLDIGLSGVIGAWDINGKALKNIDWYSKNDLNYQKSFVTNVGIVAGIHYIIGQGRDYY